MTNIQRAKVFALCVAGAIIAAAPLFPGCSKKETAVVQREFVCFDDGQLVERQVGIASYQTGSDDGMWYLKYKDNETVGWAVYKQPEGETCFVEDVR
jgi:hypothetical protein